MYDHNSVKYHLEYFKVTVVPRFSHVSSHRVTFRRCWNQSFSKTQSPAQINSHCQSVSLVFVETKRKTIKNFWRVTYRMPHLKLPPKLFVIEKKVFRVEFTLFRGTHSLVIINLGLYGRALEISRWPLSFLNETIYFSWVDMTNSSTYHMLICQGYSKSFIVYQEIIIWFLIF